MKKRRPLLFVFLSVFALTSCDLLPGLNQPSKRRSSKSNDDDVSEKSSDDLSSNHKHTWTYWETTIEATCAREGEQKRECTVCHEVETRTLGMVGHTWGDWIMIQEPTCDEPGISETTCVVCGAKERTDVAPIGHEFTEITTAEAVNTPKMLYFRCNRCFTYAMQWDASEYDQNATTGTIRTDTNNGFNGINFTKVQYKNGDTSDAGTHIIYNIFSPVSCNNLGLSFYIRTKGYPVFDNYEGDTSIGYEYNDNGVLQPSTKRFGLKINDVKIPLGNDTTGGEESGTIGWFDWPVSFKLEAGINRIELYCLGGYRPSISQFQIIGYGPELVSGGGGETPNQYVVNITNKATLQGELYIDNTYSVNLDLVPSANPTTELRNGNLHIISSDPSVVRVNGLSLTALKVGSSTITVAYHNSRDFVIVDVLDAPATAKYGTVHNGTIDDPFDNEDAILVAKSPNYEQESYYVRGKVASFYYAPGSRTDGMVAYFIEPATEGGEKFEFYKCFKEDGSALTDDDIWIGGIATAHGKLSMYNTQPEMNPSFFVSCEGDKPTPPSVIEKTFSEVYAIGTALANSYETYDYYKFQAYVTWKNGSSYYLTANKAEELIAGTSDAEHGERSIYLNAIQLYSVRNEDVANLLLKNAKVEIKMIVKNYYGTVENARTLTLDDVNVIEEGGNWEVAQTAYDFIPTETISGDEEHVSYQLGTIGGKRAIHISAMDGSFEEGASRKSSTADGFMKLNSDNTSISYKFNYSGVAYNVKLYIRAMMDDWSYSQNVGFFKNAYSGPTEDENPNMQLDINGQTIDLSNKRGYVYKDFLNGGEASNIGNHSPINDIEMGEINLVNGENIIRFTRLASYTLLIKDYLIIFG